MVRFGILGAGHIASKMAKTINMIVNSGYTDVKLVAVASRSTDKSEAFAKEHGVAKAYGSYQDMLADQEVDLVYVATPHSHHYRHCMMCLEAGKHVLCEKAFTVNSAQAQAVFDYARSKNLYVGEAMWTRYMPWLQVAKAVVEDCKLGRPQMVTAHLSYPVSGNERIYLPELAGGALLDLGVYLLNFVVALFGMPSKISSVAVLNEHGVDVNGSYTLTYKSGMMAVLCCGTKSSSDRLATVYFENGYMQIDNVNCPQKITLLDNMHNVIDTVDLPFMFTGFEYQVLAAAEAVNEGWTEHPSMEHADTFEIMSLMDTVRKQIGVEYPDEIERL